MNPALDIATTPDRMSAEPKLRCAAPRYDPGGGGINVARAVHALGGDAVAIFPIGGPAGEMIRHLLDEEASIITRSKSPGSPAKASPSRERADRQANTGYILRGPEIPERDQERCLGELSLLAPAAAYIVASGSLPLGVSADSMREWPGSRRGAASD